jgi:adenylate cyclase
MTNSQKELPGEQSYPLARIFYSRLFPALVLLMIAIVFLVSLTVSRSTENAYLEQAARTAENIATHSRRTLPGVWEKLLSGGRLTEVEKERLKQVLFAQQSKHQLIGLKVYSKQAQTLHSHNAEETGQIERAPALTQVISAGLPSVVNHREADGTKVYEMYVPVFDQGQMSAIFELYEHKDGNFRAMTNGILLPVAAALAALLGLFLMLFIPVVSHAQKEIDTRTLEIGKIRKRLENLLSRKAVTAMKHNEGDVGASSRITMTLLYSDIRGFTKYCEVETSETVVSTLNDIVDIQVEEIERHDGDVDKIIGDAILARFEGEQKEQNAVKAAISIQKRLANSRQTLRIGIGIHSGMVIAGVVGTGSRLDYTIIGDSVNVAARLCSLAKPEEIICDSLTLSAAGISGFSAARDQKGKGRSATISTTSWTVANA